jgi:6-pyruvoyltetrahydropterin/6-carboxytetrahydropterin synthase
MSKPQFFVELAKEAHTFSAAHFITYNGTICESLHGHNYRVKCEVGGDLDENGYVIDFIALRDRLSAIVAGLDHRVLLPTEHAMIQVSASESEVTAKFENKRWIFPIEDCVLLPIANTTAELLAWYIGEKLTSESRSLFHDQIRTITIMVDENHGQWGKVSRAVR